MERPTDDVSTKRRNKASERGSDFVLARRSEPELPSGNERRDATQSGQNPAPLSSGQV
jgi:hypothetical protein